MDNLFLLETGGQMALGPLPFSPPGCLSHDRPQEDTAGTPGTSGETQCICGWTDEVLVLLVWLVGPSLPHLRVSAQTSRLGRA